MRRVVAAVVALALDVLVSLKPVAELGLAAGEDEARDACQHSIHWHHWLRRSYHILKSSRS
jgi:hypothetical protein